MLLHISTVRVTLADNQAKVRRRQMKDGESRDKLSTRAGKESWQAP